MGLYRRCVDNGAGGKALAVSSVAKFQSPPPWLATADSAAAIPDNDFFWGLIENFANFSRDAKALLLDLSTLALPGDPMVIALGDISLLKRPEELTCRFTPCFIS
jgi:hypothetical protein